MSTSKTKPPARGRLARFLALVLVGSVVLSACEALRWTFIVDVDIPEQTVLGDPVQAGNPMSLTITIPFDITQEQEYQDEVFDFIREVALVGIVLNIAPTSQYPDFTFVDSATLWLDATDGSGISLQIAFVNSGDPQLQPGVTTLEAETTGVDVIDIIERGQYELRLEVEGTVPDQDVVFDGVASIALTVGLF